MAKKEKKQVPSHSGQTVSDTFATILQHGLELVMEWEQAARSWDDIEGVHQVRVAFRRMRSALTTFRTAVPKTITQPWSEEMRSIAGSLGPARDLDVFITEVLVLVDERIALPGREKLIASAERHRAVAYESVRTMLDGERYARFKETFPSWVDSREWMGAELEKKQRNRLEGNVIPYARKVLDKQMNEVLATGSHVNQDDAAEMHKLRIECKKMRYAAEYFTSIFHGMPEFIRHMKGLQDLLGVMNDAAVMPDLLETVLEGKTDPEMVEYAGGLVGWRAREYYDLKDAFDGYWEEFSGANRPWWKKSAVITN